MTSAETRERNRRLAWTTERIKAASAAYRASGHATVGRGEGGMVMKRHSATITFRPGPALMGGVPDTRPVSELPTMVMAWRETEADMTRALAAECADLERQGYRIEGVERSECCADCGGSGKRQVKPKGWRKRSDPPWYMMRTVACGCGAGGEE